MDEESGFACDSAEGIQTTREMLVFGVPPFRDEGGPPEGGTPNGCFSIKPSLPLCCGCNSCCRDALPGFGFASRHARLGFQHGLVVLSSDGMVLSDDRIILRRCRMVLQRSRIILLHDRIVLRDDRMVLQSDRISPSCDGIVLQSDRIILRRCGVVLSDDRAVLRFDGFVLRWRGTSLRCDRTSLFSIRRCGADERQGGWQSRPPETRSVAP